MMHFTALCPSSFTVPSAIVRISFLTYRRHMDAVDRDELLAEALMRDAAFRPSRRRRHWADDAINAASMPATPPKLH